MGFFPWIFLVNSHPFPLTTFLAKKKSKAAKILFTALPLLFQPNTT
jgi:hypothetical protein